MNHEVRDDPERPWGARIERARALQDNQHAFTDGLRLYEATLKFQREVALASRSVFNPQMPLRLQIDVALACSKLPSLFAVAQEQAPEALRVRAKALEEEGEAVWRRLFESALFSSESIQHNIDDFFIRACLQPVAENLQSQLAPDRNYTKSICPACGGLPQAAVLRPEGEGASRYLLCSFCLGEWLFRRIVCPFCGEEDKEKLPRYSAAQYDYVHVESCDTCMHYLKAVDLNMNGLAVPLVDEAALVVLDLWAAERSYTKMIPNLIGF